MGGAACDSLIGLEEWEDPAPEADGAGGGGAPGSGGSGGDSTGGGGGAGGSTGAGIVDKQQGGPACDACLVNCKTPIEACESDASCKAKYSPCMFEPGACCKANGGQWLGQLAQTAYACILDKCSLSCPYLNPHCGDCLMNGDETDIDCGGDACSPCESGQKCAWDTDCESGSCSASGTCL